MLLLELNLMLPSSSISDGNIVNFIMDGNCRAVDDCKLSAVDDMAVVEVVEYRRM